MISERYQFVSQIMTNVTRGATIDQKMDQAGPGGWQGAPTNQPTCEKNNANTNTQMM